MSKIDPKRDGWNDKTNFQINTYPDEKFEMPVNRSNPLGLLCELAVQEEWCEELYCGTCGHTHFRYGLLEIAHGKSPADDDWIVNNKITDYHDLIGEFPKTFSIEDKISILEICLETNIKEPKIPFDYLGLVLHHIAVKRVNPKVLRSQGYSTDEIKVLPICRARVLYEKLSRKWAKVFVKTVNVASGFWTKDKSMHFNVSNKSYHDLNNIIKSHHRVLTAPDLQAIEKDWENQEFFKKAQS
jgi:hypothetical protein